MIRKAKAHMIRKAKAHLVLNLVSDLNGHKKGFYRCISSKRKTGEYVGC